MYILYQLLLRIIKCGQLRLMRQTRSVYGEKLRSRESYIGNINGNRLDLLWNRGRVCVDVRWVKLA